MARRLRVPFLLDALIVKDDAEMARLDSERSLRRGLSGRGPLLHRLIWRRIRGTFSIDGKGLLPTFEPREDAARAAAQHRADAWLSGKASAPQPFDRESIAALAQYVAGAEPAVPLGVTVQQVVGRMFDPSYTATRESYKAARVVNSVLGACPLNLARSLWWKLTGRLASSRELLWKLGSNDPVVIHSTAIAVHSLVASLERMRAAMRADGAWQATPAQAVAESLVAPPRLMRQCVRETKAGDKHVRPGTLVFFPLEKMHRGTESNELALVDGQWNQCPAHAIVPRLLEDVWRAAVGAVAAQRYRPRRSLASRVFVAPVVRLFAAINRRWRWYRLPRPLGFWNLAVLRGVLRQRNLFDTSLLPSSSGGALPAASPDVLRWRTADGSFNDLRDLNMGRAGTRFGRNVPLGYTYHPGDRALLDPNPRVVSHKLFTRKDRQKFAKAETLNVLAAAWTQFQVHDWFFHGKPDYSDLITIPIDDKDWPGPRPMVVGRTRPDPTRSDNPPVGPPTYVNEVTHWWDASQLYGSDLATQRRVRSGRDGKLFLDGRDRLPVDPGTGIEISGFTENWWLGLSLLHHLFTAEHNAICDRLRAEYPSWDDEQLFQTARLINAALIAKIHEIEWTPTILAHRTVQKGLYASWWGLFGKWIATKIGRFHALDLLGGIPGSATNHHAAPFAMTEEFVSVYRMHAFMMPETFEVYAVDGRRPVDEFGLADIFGSKSHPITDKYPLSDLVYSFGRALPGALTLGNYATALQQFVVPGPPGKPMMIDLAAVDILRDRERGVPRYNQFRELLRLPPVRTFEELNPEWADTLRDVYGSVDRIDLMVGLFAETKPSGFGFSETTFRIFLLMNPRRLKSDRFYTADYRPEIYTQVGLDWIDTNGMRSVLLRHYPQLEPVLPKKPSEIFAPWAK
jgi:hypothetical protein